MRMEDLPPHLRDPASLERARQINEEAERSDRSYQKAKAQERKLLKAFGLRPFEDDDEEPDEEGEEPTKEPGKTK